VSLFLIFFKVIGLHKQCRALKRGDKGFLSDPSLSACEIFHVDFSKNDLTTHRKLMNMALPDTFDERAWNKSVSQKTENAVLFPPFSPFACCDSHHPSPRVGSQEYWLPRCQHWSPSCGTQHSRQTSRVNVDDRLSLLWTF
jgi:hypothetical protein